MSVAAPMTEPAPHEFYNRGLASYEARRFEEAVLWYRRGLAQSPADGRLLNNLGRTLNRLGRFEEAEDLLRRAIALDAEKRPMREFNLAINLLSRGRWKEAWPLYEARLAVQNVMPAMPYACWDGKPKANRVLLLRAEQGLGDAILFARFASVMGTAMRVVLQVPPRLVPLLSTLRNVRRVFGTDQIIRSDVDDIVWAPLLSMPLHLGLPPDAVPASKAYLSAEQARIARWRGWLPEGGLRVGIAWQGSPDGEVDWDRSVALAQFQALAEIEGVTLVSLQKGFGSEQIAQVPFGARIVRPPDDLDADSAFLDSAALMIWMLRPSSMPRFFAL